MITMKCDIINLSTKKKSAIELDDDVFGVEVRKDLLARAVRWQLANRQAGTHKTKQRSEVNSTRTKPMRQKGSGRARQGFARAAQMRGGGVVFGPTVRSHAIKLPKKVRRLALKCALSSKQSEGKLVVIESDEVKSPKTKDFAKVLSKLNWGRALMIASSPINDNLGKAAKNIVGLDVLPSVGANVYDILRRDTLVITKDAVAELTERLK